MFSYAMTVQLEHINHLLGFFTNLSYYAGNMLGAFNNLLCLKLCWHNWLVPNYSSPIYDFICIVLWIAICIYFSRYLYSHICCSMAGYDSSQGHDINKLLTSNVKQ